jgi:hypothetical protein
MKLPQYLIDALYQFSKESIDEQEEFDRIHEEELAASEKAKVKESWLQHLFRSSN